MKIKPEKIVLSKQNYVGLAICFGILALGAIGGIAKNQQWAENIYTFITIGLAIIFVFSALLKAKFKPIREFAGAFFIHAIFCAAMGWWWLCLYWIIIDIALLVCMHFYIEDYERKQKGEDKN